MPQYQWVQLSDAVAALAGRLADPTNVFWSQPELTDHIQEALRTWNALTEQWNADFSFNPSSQVWYNVDQLPDSPRPRTLTDVDLYTSMEYMLLEPPTGGTWTGTSQFAISDLSGALQRRRDEMIQATGCNLSQLPAIATTPNTRRIFFPDSTLEPRRARWVPVSGSPQTLSREDDLAWDSFESSHLQKTGTPYSWSVIAGPPLAMDVDIAPNQSGGYDVLSLQAGSDFAPPGATLLNVPDDWAWLAKWGALADLLGRDSEATDRQRADYCLKRYQQGLEVMKEANWLLLATINGVPVDTPSVKDMDGFSPEWENDPTAWPNLVTAGMDLLAPCPTLIVPAIEFIGSATTQAGIRPTPVTLIIPYASGVGNTLVLFVGVGVSFGSVSGITTKVIDSAGNQWTRVEMDQGTNFLLQCWTATSTVPVTSVTVTLSGGTATYNYTAGLSEYENISGAAIQVNTYSGSGSVASITQSLQYANDFLVAGFFARANVTFSLGPEGNFRYTVTNGLGASLGSGDNTASTASPVSVALDFAPPEVWAAVAIELVSVPLPNISVELTVVGNAPIPVNLSDFVQVSRDVYDVILDYAQVLASFKMGGEEFAATKDLEQNFFKAALATNKRLTQMGVFADMLHLEGNRQNIDQPR